MNIILSKRYAEAFISYVKPILGLDEIVDEFKNLKFVLVQNPELKVFLENYGILHKEKYDTIESVLKDFSRELRDFLKYLVRKDRIMHILEMCDYVRVTYAHGETVDALLKTSYPLDLELVQAIKESAERKCGKKLNLHIQYDGDLLGGVCLTVGNLVFDGSVKKRLEELREKLKTVRI